MAYLNTEKLLNDIQTRVQDDSPELRARMLVWLNEAMRMVVNQPREWEFARKTASLLIAANSITLPADFGHMTSVQAGEYFLTPDEQLTEEDAYFKLQEGGTEAEGFILTATGLTFVPATTATTATLKYVATVNDDYADDEADTIFPVEFGNLLKRAVLSFYYEWDQDAASTISLQLDAKEMKQMKALDNRKKSMPKVNSHGYIKERL